MRKPHTLSHRNKSDLPSRIAFLDTETTLSQLPTGETLHTLKLGYSCICARRPDNKLIITHETTITRDTDYWLWFTKQLYTKQRLIIVCHNITYDATVTRAFTILPMLGYKLTSLYKEGLVGFFAFKNGTKEIIFVDNGNFFSGKLERWGDLVSLPKMPIDFDTTNDEYLLTYCKNDVMIMLRLWELWLKFLSDNDLGEFRITTASTAFNAYRHRFMSHKIYIHADEQTILEERKAYHGGRVECLYSGHAPDQDYYYIDVNSMYPYVMRDNFYPTVLRGSSDTVSIQSLTNKLSKYAVIADVTLQCDEPIYPIKLHDTLCYPVGTMRTTLTTPELQYALNHHWIKQVHWIAHYECEKVFTEYVDFFYNLKLHYKQIENLPFTEIVKLYLNALYGKFGQLSTQQIEIGDCDPNVVMITDGHNHDTQQKFTMTWLGGTITQTIREGESYDSFPAIAAHVTAYARLYLYNCIVMAGIGNCYYVDTDSLIVNKTGYNKLQSILDNTQLGSLKIEHSAHDLTIYAPKDYVMGTRVRTKGVSQSAGWLSPHTITQTQWAGIKGMIRRGNVDRYTTSQVHKTLARKITSGVIGDDGWITPFDLDAIS